MSAHQFSYQRHIPTKDEMLGFLVETDIELNEITKATVINNTEKKHEKEMKYQR